MNANERITGEELRRSLNLIIISVTFGMAFFVIVQGPPLTGFTRALGAGDLVYSVIMAMPVLGSVFQVIASYFLENTGRRKTMFLVAGFIHRLIWIPVALVPLLVPVNYNVLRIWAVTVLITISSIASSVVGVTFFSWMGSIVPMDIRGRFFSKRTMIYTISSAIAGFVGARVLDIAHNFNIFAIVFIGAAIFGTIDIVCFIWVKDPPMAVSEEKIPFIRLFSEPFGNRNYMRFILFISFWNFGVNFAGPFFNVYMLEELKMNYTTIILYTTVISNIATILLIRLWGKLVDRYGNKPVMAICSSLVVILPTLWCFATPRNFFIILIINVMGGALWPGIEMTATNLSIWLAPEKNRSIYVANYALVSSIIGIAIAYICGGAFKEFTNPLLHRLDLPFIMGQRLNSFHALFIMSGILRLLAILIFLPGVREENSLSALQTIDKVLVTIKKKTKNMIAP